MGEVFDFGLKGVDLNQIVGNAMHLPQAISLAQQGRIDEAADIYSQITGMEHADAVSAVKDMANGHAVSLTPGRPGATWQQFETSYSQPSVEISTPAASTGSVTTSGKATGSSCGLIIGIVAAVAILIVALVGGGLFFFSNGSPANPINSVIPLGFASKTLTFGAEGIGAGMFQDPRHIGVDSNGNITVADYQDGRIQTFDSAGKFASGFSVSAAGKKVYLSGMAVGRDGTIYLAHDQKIFVYDASGNKTKEIGDDQHDYKDVVVGADGKLYALDNSESIVRFKPDGKVDLEIKDTFAQVTGDMDIDTHLAVDGLGNMYIVGAFHYLVLKYSPQGNFIDQFGGQAKDAAINEPGKFTSPEAIAVDGYGRIYVSDFLNIQVFDPIGTYLNSIGIDKGAAFGLEFDDQNNLYVVTNQNIVTKYKVQPPASK
jgi:sugar lactone lactonase YvrE